MKKFISIILALELLIGCVAIPFGVIANTNPSHPTPTDVSAYWDGTKTAIAGSTLLYHPLGDEENNKNFTVYEVSNAKELCYVFNLDELDNVKIVLKDDIYLNKLNDFDTWSTTGIGLNSWVGQKDTSIERFELDGQGHIIYGMYAPSGIYGGLFAKLETTAATNVTDRPFVIRNLGIDYSFVNTTVASAFIAGSGEKYSNTGYGNSFIFENCFAGDNVTLKGKVIGGFVGKEWLVMSSLKFENCYSNVKLVPSTDATYTGTFAGDITNASPFNHRKVVMAKCYSATDNVMFARFGPHSSSSAPQLDPTVNFATSALKGTVATFGAYTTSLTKEKMTGKEPLTSMKKLGSAYVTTAKYPQLKIFLEKNGTLDSKVNIPLGTKVGHTTITEKLSETTYLEDLSENYSENLLLGDNNVKIGYYKNGTLTDEAANASTVENATIGEWCKETNTCKTQDVDNSVPQTNNYWQVEVQLKATANDMTKFVFASHKTNSKLMPKRYTVYMSKNKDTLYDNPVFTVDDWTERYADEYDLTQVDIDQTKLKDIQYFAIRIYNTGYEQNGCLIQHMKLLGLYKEPNGYSQVTEKINGSTYLQDLTKNYGENQLDVEGTTVEFAYYKDGVKTTEGWDANKVQQYDENNKKLPVKLKDLIIGQWCKKANTCKTYGVDNTNLEQTTSYWQINVALPETIFAPNKFVFASHESNKAVMPKHYAVFASDTASTLFDNEIFSVTNEKERYADEYSLNGKDIDQSKLNGIKYIAIRIYSVGYVHNPQKPNHTMGSLLQHVKLIGLYGNTGVPIPMENNTAVTTDVSSYLGSLGENQIADKIYKSEFYADNTLANVSYVNVGVDKKLYAEHNPSDCVINGAENNITQTDNYLQWSVNLDGRQVNPEKLVILADENSDKKMSQHYAIYLSESESELFNAKNKYIEIKDTNDRYGDEIDLTKLTGIGKTQLGKISYIGIRFYHRGYEDSCGCTGQDIKLIGLYGGTFKPIYIDYYNSNKEYSEKEFKRDLTDHGKSLIGGTEPYLTKHNGAKAKDCNLTEITDGILTKHTDIEVYRGENDGAYDMIYRLDSNPDVIKQINML